MEQEIRRSQIRFMQQAEKQHSECGHEDEDLKIGALAHPTAQRLHSMTNIAYDMCSRCPQVLFY